ncbi:MAG: hypothetical protein HC926_00890 [Synechococcaceae cyanobacterium SM2_3_60]|nr:hypothetical protein [Synechococcaceae cyanobacterium SM2_3_60]
MHPQVRRYIPWLRRFTHRLGGRLEIGGVSPAWTGQVVTLLCSLPLPGGV